MNNKKIATRARGRSKVEESSSFDMLNRYGYGFIDIHGNGVISVLSPLRSQYPLIIFDMISKIFNNKTNTSFISISGARNSTKSTTTQRVSALLNRDRGASNISLDSYIMPNDYFLGKGIDISVNAKDPIGINFENLYENLASIKSGKSFDLQIRDRFKPGHFGGETKILPKTFFLAEGISSSLPNSLVLRRRLYNHFIPMVSKTFDLKIFLKISKSTAEKNLFNDHKVRQKLKLSKMNKNLIYKRFKMSDLPRFKDHYQESQSNSDIIFELDYSHGRYIATRIVVSEVLMERINRGLIL